MTKPGSVNLIQKRISIINNILSRYHSYNLLFYVAKIHFIHILFITKGILRKLLQLIRTEADFSQITFVNEKKDVCVYESE